jgi:integrase
LISFIFILLFVRLGELRHAEWADIDVSQLEWRIPAHKTIMRTQHIVPLSTQSVAIFESLRPETGSGKYVFPGRTSSRPMSDNTIGAALRYLGDSTQADQSAHGFRSIASTLLNELGWNRDAIERQLGHAERDGVRAAYNYAEYLPERRRMIQAWADYLDQLQAGAGGTNPARNQATSEANAETDGQSS